jgi:hypothetical protein
MTLKTRFVLLNSGFNDAFIFLGIELCTSSEDLIETIVVAISGKVYGHGATENILNKI